MPKSQNHATKEYFLVLDHDGLPSFYEETLWSQSIHTLFVSKIASTGWYHGDLVDGCGDDDGGDGYEDNDVCYCFFARNEASSPHYNNS